MLSQRLSIFFAHIKTENNWQNLLTEIRQVAMFLYQSKENYGKSMQQNIKTNIKCMLYSWILETVKFPK